MTSSLRNRLVLSFSGIACIIIGALAVIILSVPVDVHHHANIAVFINGKKVSFDDSRYMEETTRCAIDPSKQRPEDRTHFHENNGDLVHVHAAGVTWGHLMGNIGWNFGANYLVDDTGKIYEKNGSGSVHFILNGKSIDNPFNKLIGSADRLLVSYSTLSDEDLIKTEFPKVAATAEEANKKDDPASCGGSPQGFFEHVRDTILGHTH